MSYNITITVSASYSKLVSRSSIHVHLGLQICIFGLILILVVYRAVLTHYWNLKLGDGMAVACGLNCGVQSLLELEAVRTVSLYNAVLMDPTGYNPTAVQIHK